MPGESVTLGADAALLDHEAIASEAVGKQLKAWAYIYDDSKMIASPRVYNLWDYGQPMRAGAKLKIMGYEGDALGGWSHLFVLVQVISD